MSRQLPDRIHANGRRAHLRGYQRMRGKQRPRALPGILPPKHCLSKDTGVNIVLFDRPPSLTLNVPTNNEAAGGRN